MLLLARPLLRLVGFPSQRYSHRAPREGQSHRTARRLGIEPSSPPIHKLANALQNQKSLQVLSLAVSRAAFAFIRGG